MCLEIERFRSGSARDPCLRWGCEAPPLQLVCVAGGSGSGQTQELETRQGPRAGHSQIEPGEGWIVHTSYVGLFTSKCPDPWKPLPSRDSQLSICVIYPPPPRPTPHRIQLSGSLSKVARALPAAPSLAQSLANSLTLQVPGP